MHVIEHSFQLTQIIVPYTLLLYILLILKTEKPATVNEAATNIPAKLPGILLQEQRHLVYGLIAGGIVAATAPSLSILGIILSAAIILHGIATHTQPQEEITSTLSEKIVSSIAVVAALIGITAGSSIAQTATAVAILGIIFWRI